MASIKGGSGTFGGSYYSQNYYAGNQLLALEFEETFQDSIALAESSSSKPFKVLLESIVLSEAYSKVGAFFKSLSESITASEAYSSIKALVISLSDSIVASEVYTSLKSFGITLSDSIVASEAYTQAVSFVRSLSESIVIGEAYSRVGTFFKALSESINLVDIRTSITNKILSSTMVIQDSLSSLISYVLVLSENIGINEALRKALSLSKLVESVVLEDISSIQKTLTKYFIETIHAVENFLSDVDKFFSQFFSESIVVSENWNRILGKLLGLVDNISITEVVSRILPSKIFVDSVDMLDSLVKKSIKSFGELIGLVDTGIKNMFKSLSSAIVLTESFSFLKLIIKRFAETISMIDTTTFVNIFVKVFQDTIQLVEGFGSDITRIFTESLVVIDTKIFTPIKTFVESINLSESISKNANILLSSILRISDSRLVRKLNGQIVEWGKRVRKVLEWSGVVKKEDQYINIEKKLNDWELEEKDLGSYQSNVKPLDDWTKLRKK